MVLAAVDLGRVGNRPVSARFHSHCLLDKAEEELPPAPRGSAVETEAKFIEIVVQVIETHRPLVCAQQPTFEQRDDAVDKRGSNSEGARWWPRRKVI